MQLRTGLETERKTLVGEPAPGTGTITGYLVESGEPACVRFSGGTITAIDAVAVAPPRWLSPGFIDLQVNGFAGHDFHAGDGRSDEIAAVVHALWAHGVTTICPTIATASEDHILRCLASIADARERDPVVAHAIPAIHVEGPHISPEDGPRGVHPLDHVRPPDLDEYRRWQAAARGLVGIVTLAPEYPGAMEYIRTLVAEGVVVGIGHTAADETAIRAAIEAGARLSTHLGNGAHATIRRHPNYIWDQLSDDRLHASVILDGQHLPRAVIRAFLRAKGIRQTIAVSDVVALAGMPPGDYGAFGTRLELRQDGALVVAGTPYLAGSTSPLDVAVGVAIRDGGLSVSDAVSLVTANPAALIASRLGSPAGTIAVGASADMVGFRVGTGGSRVIIERTIVEGQDVFRREPSSAAGGVR